MSNIKKLLLLKKKEEIKIPFYNSNLVDNIKFIDFKKNKLKNQNLLFLANYYISDKGNKYGSAHNYVKYYEKYFNKLKNEKLNILEIGIAAGSSLKMWSSYFPNSTIYGIDINPDCLNIESLKSNMFDKVKLLIGDASNYNFNDLKFDIIIDDGSHLPIDIINTFNNLKSNLKKDGIYVIEDLKTCDSKKYILKLKNLKKEFDTYSDDSFLKINSSETLDNFFNNLSNNENKKVNIHTNNYSSIAFII